MAAVEIDKFTKFYGDFLAVNEVSFSVHRGEILGLLGPNGAGKSTTIRSLCGYLEPSSGNITVNGWSVKKDPNEVKTQIGYLPESAPLYSDMMVYDYLWYIAEIRNIKNPQARILDLSEMCGLKEKMHVNIAELSKGYKQRVGLAHAMMSDPEVLVLDEPTSGLDPNQIVEIRELIREMGREKTVILSTHIMQEVEAVCDRVIIIDRGQIKANNTTQALKTSANESMEISMEIQGADFDAVRAELSSVQGVSSVIRAADSSNHADENLTRVHIKTEGQEDIRPGLYHKIKNQSWVIYEMKRQVRSLENIFQELTRN